MVNDILLHGYCTRYLCTVIGKNKEKIFSLGNGM